MLHFSFYSSYFLYFSSFFFVSYFDVHMLLLADKDVWIRFEKDDFFMKKKTDITSALLAWYDQNKRSMPWRDIHDPYCTWVSEAMLQQTRVETVLSYYEKFLSRFPSLSDLASADEADVLKMWEGLGYYSRARNLHQGAIQVMEQYAGILPRDPALLRKIRGIGPYTAGAIASIAYGIPAPAVDGNVIRVYSRLFGIRDNIQIPENRRKIENLAASLVPEDRPGDYNQAVMDLGATVCTPGTPDCDRCPLFCFCDAKVQGDAADLPVLPRSHPPKVDYWTVPVLRSGNLTLVRRRTESLLNGLWSFPLLSCIPEEAIEHLENRWHLVCRPVGFPEKARHVFTHRIWEMSILPLEVSEHISAPDGFHWIPYAELHTLAFPAAMSVALRAADHLFAN